MTEKELLIPKDEYLKSGIHIGTKFKTKHMEKFIFQTRPDGLSVLNVQQIDKRIKAVVNLLSQYEPESVLIFSRRESSWKAVKLFSEITGIKVYTGRYPPGLLTNPNLEIYREAKLIMVTDPWPDKNAVEDAEKIGLPLVALCDSNNKSNDIDLVMPCNNKGRKSLALFFWILSKTYLEKKGLKQKIQKFDYKIEDFMSE